MNSLTPGWAKRKINMYFNESLIQGFNFKRHETLNEGEDEDNGTWRSKRTHHCTSLKWIKMEAQDRTQCLPFWIGLLSQMKWIRSKPQSRATAPSRPAHLHLHACRVCASDIKRLPTLKNRFRYVKKLTGKKNSVHLEGNASNISLCVCVCVCVWVGVHGCVLACVWVFTLSSFESSSAETKARRDVEVILRRVCRF